MDDKPPSREDWLRDQASFVRSAIRARAAGLEAADEVLRAVLPAMDTQPLDPSPGILCQIGNLTHTEICLSDDVLTTEEMKEFLRLLGASRSRK